MAGLLIPIRSRRKLLIRADIQNPSIDSDIGFFVRTQDIPCTFDFIAGAVIDQ